MNDHCGRSVKRSCHNFDFERGQWDKSLVYNTKDYFQSHFSKATSIKVRKVVSPYAKEVIFPFQPKVKQTINSGGINVGLSEGYQVKKQRLSLPH